MENAEIRESGYQNIRESGINVEYRNINSCLSVLVPLWL